MDITTLREAPGSLTEIESALLARAADWPGDELEALSQPALARLAAAHGTDFATALLYDRLRRSERHGAFIQRIDEWLADPPRDVPRMDVLLAVAPGAYYRELPRAGGDGRLLRERAAEFGWRTALIPTESLGTVAENGRIIRDWLTERRGERVVLASLSKGAADFKAALAEPDADDAFRSVIAWLNLSGLPSGTPIANWLAERRLATLFYKAAFWWLGAHLGPLWQTTWGPGGPLDFPLRLPAHVQMISVVGFPVTGRFSSKPLWRYHRRIAHHGPNDGLLLLADACALPGLVYPIWGADHNLRPGWDIRRLATALACHLAEERP